MMRKMSKKKVFAVIGCVVLIIAIVFTAQNSYRFSIPEDIEEAVDVNDSITIGDEDVPLGDAKTSTKTSTKKSTKTKKLSKAATKTSKAIKTSTKKSSNTAIKSTNQIDTNTTVKTTITTKNTKGSKVQKITTKVVTTVKTTTTALEVGEMDITKIASKADSKLISLYKDLGYTATVDPNVSYTGYFSARTKSITLKKQDGTTIYHELGHFLAYRAGNVDRSNSFKSIYDEEKSLYTASNKNYVLQSPMEYFAESYRDYVEENETLKKERPKTYEYIANALTKIR